MLNALFMLGIWGLVKTVKTYKECKALNANNEQADRLISDYQQNLEREKNESDLCKRQSVVAKNDKSKQKNIVFAACGNV